MLKKSVRELDDQVKEHIKHSVEKERGEWAEKSLITSSELVKFQVMLEAITSKLDTQEEFNLKEARSELSLVKAQVRELLEFHKRLKEMSIRKVHGSSIPQLALQLIFENNIRIDLKFQNYQNYIAKIFRRRVRMHNS